MVPPGDVALSCTVTPVVTSPPTCAFATTPVPGGSGTSALTISTTAATPPGGYTITVSGVAGTYPHQGLSLTVTAAVTPDFTIGCDSAHAGLGSCRSIIYFDGHDCPSQRPRRPGGSDLHRHTRSDSHAHLRTEPSLTDGHNAHLDADGKYHRCATASLEPRSQGLFYAMLLPIGGLALLGTGITSRKKKLWGFLLGCILFSGLMILPACGGGNSSGGGGGGGGGHPGTPAGVYTVTVTGTSGSLTHAVTPALTFTVN